MFKPGQIIEAVTTDIHAGIMTGAIYFVREVSPHGAFIRLRDRDHWPDWFPVEFFKAAFPQFKVGDYARALGATESLPYGINPAGVYAVVGVTQFGGEYVKIQGPTTRVWVRARQLTKVGPSTAAPTSTAGHSTEHPGLQKHSVGELYPFIIVAYGDGKWQWVNHELKCASPRFDHQNTAIRGARVAKTAGDRLSSTYRYHYKLHFGNKVKVRHVPRDNGTEAEYKIDFGSGVVRRFDAKGVLAVLNARGSDYPLIISKESTRSDNQ